jgi:hypothetical protein
MSTTTAISNCIKATLSPTSEDWKICEKSEDVPVRALGFVSEVSDSLIQGVRILGWGNGDIELEVAYRQTTEKTDEVFKENGSVGFLHKAKAKVAREKLFAEVLKNCRFPIDKIPLASTLATVDQWKRVTPLAQGEVLQFSYPKEEEVCKPFN